MYVYNSKTGKYKKYKNNILKSFIHDFLFRGFLYTFQFRNIDIQDENKIIKK